MEIENDSFETKSLDSNDDDTLCDDIKDEYTSFDDAFFKPNISYIIPSFSCLLKDLIPPLNVLEMKTDNIDLLEYIEMIKREYRDNNFKNALKYCEKVLKQDESFQSCLMNSWFIKMKCNDVIGYVIKKMNNDNHSNNLVSNGNDIDMDNDMDMSDTKTDSDHNDDPLSQKKQNSQWISLFKKNCVEWKQIQILFELNYENKNEDNYLSENELLSVYVNIMIVLFRLDDVDVVNQMMNKKLFKKFGNIFNAGDWKGLIQYWLNNPDALINLLQKVVILDFYLYLLMNFIIESRNIKIDCIVFRVCIIFK